MKNKSKIVIGTALLLAALPALAGIVSLPSGGQYTDAELASVTVSKCPGDFNIRSFLRVRTSGLTGELSIDADDLPPELGVPVPGCARLPVDQRLELVINLSLGAVEGRSRGRIITQNGPLEFRTDVSGNASCRSFNGRSCGQLVRDLELRGTLSDPTDPTTVGLVRMKMLASAVWDDTDVVHWASMSSNTTLGFALPDDVAEIRSILGPFEGASCGL